MKGIIIVLGIVIIVLIGVLGYMMFKEDAPMTDTPPQDEQTNTDNDTSQEGNEREIAYTPESAREQVVITNPQANTSISSPLEIRGETRGSWLFEATAPVVLTDWDGRIIAESYIEAQSDWMTEDFVPIEGTLEFDVPEFDNRGYLIIQKANASGLPEHDGAVEIPIFFANE